MWFKGNLNETSGFKDNSNKTQAVLKTTQMRYKWSKDNTNETQVVLKTTQMRHKWF